MRQNIMQTASGMRSIDNDTNQSKQSKPHSTGGFEDTMSQLKAKINALEFKLSNRRVEDEGETKANIS